MTDTPVGHAVGASGVAPRWQPTVGHARATLVAVGLAAVAVLWRRPDLLVLAAPFAVVAGWSVATRPGAPPGFDERLGRATVIEGEATRWVGTVTGEEGDHLDLVAAEMGRAPWFQLRPAGGSVVAAAGHGRAELAIGVRPTRWGRRDVPPVLVVAASPWAGFLWSTVTVGRPVVALPATGAFETSAGVRPRDGLVGVHQSARVGEGTEFAEIRPFRVGDRIRRINWPRSLRAGELHVNATWAERDVHVVLAVDASEDVGVGGGAVGEGVDGAASSLDTAVRAAGAIAGYYCRRGDRVSLRIVGPATSWSVPPATGENHLGRLHDALATVQPGSGGRHRRGARRTPPLSGEALTVLFSPLVTADVLDDAVALGRHGQPVVVVDTLPAHVTDDDDPYTALAWRIRLLERRREVRLVQELGIPVVRWAGPGSLDHFLRDVARRVAAPRIRPR